jgi:hypothetical protein
MVAQEPDTKYGSGTLSKNRYFLKSQEHHRPLSLIRDYIVNIIYQVSKMAVKKLPNE